MGHALIFRFTSDGVLAAPPHCGLLTVPDLLRQVLSWCAMRASPLVVDLSEAEALDSAALTTLVWAQRYCLSQGVPLAVVEPSAGALQREQLATLRQLVPLYGDLTSAQAAAPRPSMHRASAVLAV